MCVCDADMCMLEGYKQTISLGLCLCLCANLGASHASLDCQ